MRSVSEIRELLDEMNNRPAEDLEDQDLEFKEWKSRSVNDMARIVADIAVCMANGGPAKGRFVSVRTVSRSPGTLRRRIMVETGETDFTAVEVPGNPAAHLSALALEQLRKVARHERARVGGGENAGA